MAVTLIWALLVFGLIIVAHELGHFLVAKAVGIRVQEFAVGMGPLIWSRQVGETLYSVRLLPIGGFNRMAGMEPGEEDDPRGFNRRPLWSRLLVIAAGSGMNFILAILLFVVILSLLGAPSAEPVIGKVLQDRPAQAAGLRAGDRILAVAGRAVQDWPGVVQAINERPEKETEIRLLRGKQEMLVRVTPQRQPESGLGIIGIEASTVRYGPLFSAWLGIRGAALITVQIIRSLVDIVLQQAPPDLVGPVGIVQMVGQRARFGLASLLDFAGMLSLNLGLINLFPIPALDGSRLVFLGMEGLRGKPVDPAKENLVHLVGLALLLTLMIVITYQDILRILG